MNRRSTVTAALVLVFAACGGSTGHRRGSQGAGGSDNTAGSSPGQTPTGGAAGAGGTRSAGGEATEPKAGSAGEATLEAALEIIDLQISSCTSAYGADNTQLPALSAGREPEQYRGLECAAWDMT